MIVPMWARINNGNAKPAVAIAVVGGTAARRAGEWRRMPRTHGRDAAWRTRTDPAGLCRTLRAAGRRGLPHARTDRARLDADAGTAVGEAAHGRCQYLAGLRLCGAGDLRNRRSHGAEFLRRCPILSR